MSTTCSLFPDRAIPLSGIFGIFHDDGRPVDRAALAQMDAALSDWGPDGGGLQVDRELGVGCRLLRITVEDRHEQQPLSDQDCLLVAHVRLDNRADLCRSLGLADRPELPDSALVMAAYRRYGVACVEHLQGDWVFALWDRAEGRLILARCATGTAALYWYQQRRSLMFATGIRGLLANPDCVPTLNRQHIACLLMPLEDPEGNATVYENIHLLEPGQLLIATSGGVELRRWWWPENLAPLILPSREQYYEAFRELYGTIVGQYLRVGDGGIAATLSGGLDSGSVVAMAAPCLTQPLKAYVHVPLYEPIASPHRIGNELPQARRLAGQVGNVQILPLYSPDTSLISGIEQGLRENAVPGHAAAHEYWIHDLLASARADGARVLLIGQGGNSTVSYNGSGSLLPHLFAGQLRAALSALRADQSGLWRALKRRVIKPMVEPARKGLRERRRGDPSILSPVLARALKIRRPASGAMSSTMAFRLGLQGAGRSRARWMAAGSVSGLDIRDPTRDRRLVEFCWRLPDDVYWAQGRQRGLIRAGMADYLPVEIRDEARKGLQSSDLLARVRVQAAEIKAALDHIAASAIAIDYLDVGAMRHILDRIVAGGNSAPHNNQAHLLARGLGVGSFLAAQVRP